VHPKVFRTFRPLSYRFRERSGHHPITHGVDVPENGRDARTRAARRLRFEVREGLGFEASVQVLKRKKPGFQNATYRIL
jgi:hypothetical protein